MASKHPGDSRLGDGDGRVAGSDSRSRGEAEDAVLLAGVAAKDRAAFEALYHRYHPRLFSYLFKVTRRAELVEEVLNDVMFVVWRKAGSFDGRSRASTWIFGIAYRKALKALSRREHPPEGGAEPVSEVSPEAGAELRLVRRELVSTLGQAMARLSPEQRSVLELTYTYGYSCREIAEQQDCPVNTVKTRMFYARRRLRELLPELAAWAPILERTAKP